MGNLLNNVDDKRCKLCHELKPLRKSHIIPEFCYKHLYDKKHRLVTFSPGLPEESVFEQKGFRDRLLCDSCEQHLSKNYEKPFCEYWYSERVLSQLRAEPSTVLTGIDYSAFKLFHLSVLFRAAASDLCPDVSLGPHHDIIRGMVLDQNPGEEGEYPIVCSPIAHPNEPGLLMDFVGGAHAVSLGSSDGFYFLFGGAQWLYWLSSEGDDVIRKATVSRAGKLCAVRMPLAAIDHHRKLRALAKEAKRK